MTVIQSPMLPSGSRRALLKTGLGAAVLPLPAWAGSILGLEPARPNALTERGPLILSGRLTSDRGRAISGAVIEVWTDRKRAVRVCADADGRFLLQTPVSAGVLHYRVTDPELGDQHGTLGAPDAAATAPLMGLHADGTGTWRASVGLTLA